MKLLAFDTSTTACSAALWIDGRVSAHRHELLERGHAERLFPMLAEVLDECGVDYVGLDALAATIGPGSFTGVRVGLAAARGIMLAAGIPGTGVSTLEALAAAVSDEEASGREIVAALDARRDQVYAQLFRGDGQALTGPVALSAEDAASLPASQDGAVSPIVLVGSGASSILPFVRARAADVLVSQAPAFPDAINVAALAASKGFAAMTRRPLHPLYIRGPGAEPLKSVSDQVQA